MKIKALCREFLGSTREFLRGLVAGLGISPFDSSIFSDVGGKARFNDK